MQIQQSISKSPLKLKIAPIKPQKKSNTPEKQQEKKATPVKKIQKTHKPTKRNSITSILLLINIYL